MTLKSQVKIGKIGTVAGIVIIVGLLYYVISRKDAIIDRAYGALDGRLSGGGAGGGEAPPPEAGAVPTAPPPADGRIYRRRHKKAADGRPDNANPLCVRQSDTSSRTHTHTHTTSKETTKPISFSGIFVL